MPFDAKRKKRAYNERHRVAQHRRKALKREAKLASYNGDYGIRSPSGRVTKLDKKTYDSICKLLAEGQTMELAATLSAVDPNTLWLWVRNGQADPDGPFGQFARDVAYAKEVAHRYLVGKIATHEDWKAAAWLLKNKLPKLYRDAVSQEISGPDGNPLPVSMQTFSVVLEMHPQMDQNNNEQRTPEPQFRIVEPAALAVPSQPSAAKG